MKRTAGRITGTALLVLALLLGGCGADPGTSVLPAPAPRESVPAREEPPEPELRIGIALRNAQGGLGSRLEASFRELAARSDQDIELTICDAENRAELQAVQVERLVTEGADVIFLDPVAFYQSSESLAAVKNSGIPVVLLEDRTEARGTVPLTVLPQHRIAGQMQVEMAAEYLGGKGRIALLKDLQEVDSAILKSAGCREMLKEYPGLEVTASQATGGSPAEAYEIVENWILNGVPIDAVLAQNDDLAAAACRAVRDSGKTGSIAVFGIDGDPEMIELIRSGLAQGTLFRDAREEAEHAMEFALNMPPPVRRRGIMMPYSKVGPEEAASWPGP